MGRTTTFSRSAARLVLAAALAVPAVTAASGTVASASRMPAAAASARRVTARGWGDGTDGQLGTGHRRNVQATPARVLLPRGVRVTSVRAGCDHALALTASGRVLAWGNGARGQLGNGSTASTDRPVRVRLRRGTKIKAIRGGCRHNLALTTKDHVLAWGENALGQLGTGTRRSHSRPVRVKVPGGTRIKAVSAGCDHNLALTTRGRVLAWGFNADGQLGIGSRHNRLRPARVRFPGRVRIKIIAAGCDHSLAVSTGGQVYGWGSNAEGEVGDGTTRERDIPVKVSLDGPIGTAGPGRAAAAARVVSLFAGGRHSLALLSSGTVLAWGDNSAGQLGDGLPGSSDSPVAVALPGGSKVRAISASDFDSLALTAGGHVLAWGAGDLGQLGNGGLTGSNVPVRAALAAGLRATGIGAGAGSEALFAIVRKA